MNFNKFGDIIQNNPYRIQRNQMKEYHYLVVD